MQRQHVLSIVLVSAALAGCSSSGAPTASAPSAASPTPSVSTEASTTFTSAISILPGLRLTWPTAGWRPVDSPGNLVVYPPHLPGAALRVGKGLYPTDPAGGFLTSRIAATAVIASLRRLPELKVSTPVRLRIGKGIAAVRADIRLSPGAAASGFAYLTYRGGGELISPFSIKKGMVVRVYAAVYHAPYGNDLLNIAVEAPSASTFKQWAPLAARALETLRLPKGLVASKTWEL